MQARLGSIAVLLSVLAASVSAVAADPIVLRAARLLDVDNGRIVSPAVLVIDAQHIAGVNPERTPAGAETIDLGDVTLLPGLMDMHTHLTGDLQGDWVNRVVKETAADAALRGAYNGRVTLLAGFTTVRNLGSGGFSGVALMRAIERGNLAAVRAGVASIEHGSMLTEEIIAEMKTRGTFLVPTTYLVEAIDMSNLPPPLRAKAEFITPRAVDSLRRAIAAGVKIAYGTDAAVYPHGDNAKEFAVLVERGMSPIEAIRSATIHSADLLGVTDRGRLKTGLLADVIAVPGNPLEEIRAMEEVVFVMKDGNVYKRPGA